MRAVEKALWATKRVLSSRSCKVSSVKVETRKASQSTLGVCNVASVCQRDEAQKVSRRVGGG